MDEIVALYDDGDLTGRVTGTAPRSQVRAANLPHGATAVLLRDATDRVYVHRRTSTKDIFPDMHDAFAGGVVLAGEDPVEAARRELAEELGVAGAPLQPLLRFWYRDTHANYLAYVFEARYDPRRYGPIVHQPTEVADGWWMEQAELLARLADPQWPFVPDGRAVLRRLFAGA
ncbi:MAG: NUDIX domain-containing protein [Micromonosporaceae bacterium]|nr:NUDIX domain-containing protein [Micromonosporaceae bacterium]